MTSGATVLKQVKTKAEDGRPSIQYFIQLVDASLVDEAASFMIKHFVPNENWMSTLDFTSDKETVKETNAIFKELLSEGISIAAFLVDDQGNRGPMISCNVLNLEKGDPSEMMPQTEKMKIVFQTMVDLESQVDVLKLYNCSKYIHTFGLSVWSEYEGRGIGTEMLRARREVCRMTNTPVSATCFSGEASQKAAARCGYKTLSQLDLNTYQIDGKLMYLNNKWPVSKWMAIRYF